MKIYQKYRCCAEICHKINQFFAIWQQKHYVYENDIFSAIFIAGPGTVRTELTLLCLRTYVAPDWNHFYVSSIFVQSFSLKMISGRGQFSVGDQNSSIRIAFWSSGFSKCQEQSCHSHIDDEEEKKPKKEEPSWVKRQRKRTIRSEDHVAGCRMNGDAYGTTVFTCTVCGWETSFQYDDASEPYYYETRSWNREPSPKKKYVWNPWDGVNVRDWLQNDLKVGDSILSKCTEFGLLQGRMLSTMNMKRLKALGFSQTEAEMLLLEIQKKNKQMLYNNDSSQSKGGVLESKTFSCSKSNNDVWINVDIPKWLQNESRLKSSIIHKCIDLNLVNGKVMATMQVEDIIKLGFSENDAKALADAITFKDGKLRVESST